MTYSIFGSTWPLVGIEVLLVTIALLMAFLSPEIVSRLFSPCEGLLSNAARRPWLAVLIAMATPLALRALILPIYPPPSPTVHDDFSYLLQASTFAEGRVTNPTPPFWSHFESIYIFCTPTYNSQYEPAQGLLLAAGERVAGHPWWGAYVGMGLFFGAICWALAGSVRWRWALLGSMLISLQFGVFGYWMNSYFGGAISGIGGALIFGGLIRARQHHKDRAIALAATGLVLVAASRPVEAMIWGLVSVALLISARPSFRMLIPGTLLVVAGATALLWYNWRVTGKIFEPPYLHHLRLYGTPQPFFWQHPVTISSFRHAELRDVYLFQRGFYEQRKTIAGLMHGISRRALDAWLFFPGPVLTLPLLWAPCLWKDKRVRLWTPAIVLFGIDHLTFHRWYPQHSAAEVVLFCLILIECWRRARLWRVREMPVGRAVTQLLPMCAFLSLLVPIGGKAVEQHVPRRMNYIRVIWQPQFQTDTPRDGIEQQLKRFGGKHLVFVHYRPDHNPHHEWVYNKGDIVGSQIIWARQVNRQSDHQLSAYFNDRKAWILDADANPPRLVALDQIEPASELCTPRPSS